MAGAAPRERTFAATAVPASGRVIPSPFQFFSSGEDNLRLISFNVVSGAKVTMRARIIDTAGVIRAEEWVQTPNTDRTLASTDCPIGSGAVMNVDVFASGGTPVVGQTFIVVQLIRGLGAAAVVLGTLLQGHVTAQQHVGWPGSPIQSSIDGGGYYRTVAGTTPAVGAEVSESCPTNARWDLIAANLTFTPDPSAINRFPRVLIRTSGQTPMFSFPDNVVGASNQVNYCVSQQPKQTSVFDVATTRAWQGLPVPCILRAADSWLTSTSQMQPGDRWTAITYLVREWLEP